MASIPSLPPAGMASRALTARLSTPFQLSAVCQRQWQLGIGRHDDFNVGPERSCQQVAECRQQLGDAYWRRQQRSGAGKSEQLAGELGTTPRRSVREAMARCANGSASAMSSRICRLPEMTVSKLLKSCDATGQLAERFEPLRHQQFVFNFRRCNAFGRDVGDASRNAMSSGGKVMRCARRSDQHAVVIHAVADRRQHQ